jgi:hypothetical protein
MAKAKKSVASRKKRATPGKASAKPAPEKATKRATAKKVTKVQRKASKVAKPAGKRPTKPAARKPPSTAPTKAPPQIPEAIVETTIIDVVEEPVPGMVVVTEHESVRITSPASLDDGTEADEGIGPKTEEQ